MKSILRKVFINTGDRKTEQKIFREISPHLLRIFYVSQFIRPFTCLPIKSTKKPYIFAETETRFEIKFLIILNGKYRYSKQISEFN